MSVAPSPNGSNGWGKGGRGPGGRFAPGNAGGPGNPMARKVAALRAAMLEAVSPEDLRDVAQALVQQAKGGSVPAMRELFERTLGRPIEFDLLERIAELERQVAESQRMQQTQEGR